MCPPNTLSLVSGSEDMFDDYAELYNTVNSFDNPDHRNLSGGFFESLYSSPNLDFKHDIALIRSSIGDLIGSGIVRRTSTSLNARIVIQVHPENRRQGIGSNILKHFLRNGMNQSGTEIHSRVFSFRPYSIAFANHHGFKYDHTWVKMQYENTARTSPAHIPRGFKIRALNTKTELEIWAQLQNQIFIDNPHYERVSAESLKSLIRNINYDPNLIIVGEVGDVPIGMCMGWSTRSNKSDAKEMTLQIQGMGVLPKYRREGYATTLLLELMNRGYLKGHTKSELLVMSTNDVAMNMYNKIGFVEKYRHLWYVLRI